MSKAITLDAIQALRAFAALLVVWVHAREQFEWLRVQFPSAVGAHGVDLFFVISGFIMVVSTQGRNINTASFLRRRLIRIVPLYWLATLTLLSAALLAPGMAKSVTISWPHVTASFLFIPMESPAMPGNMFPLLIPGWSLNYEMMFYILFGICLLAPERNRTLLIISGLIFASLYWWLYQPDGILGFVCNPIILTFGTGVLIGDLYTRFHPHRRPMAAAVLCVAALASHVSLEIIAPYHRFFSIGIPAAMIVLAFLLAGEAIKWPRWLLHIGDASYSLYLSHTFVLGAARLMAGPWMREERGEAAGWFFMILSLCLSSVIAIAIHRFIEIPLTRRLQNG